MMPRYLHIWLLTTDINKDGCRVSSQTPAGHFDCKSQSCSAHCDITTTSDLLCLILLISVLLRVLCLEDKT